MSLSGCTYNVQSESPLTENSSRKSRNSATKTMSNHSHAVVWVRFGSLLKLGKRTVWTIY
ncbi:hypothetical protein N7467_010984 [Penicillium canescens]|nr:hypothetical protein N7467_010984 [Penicillium canescens]